MLRLWKNAVVQRGEYCDWVMAQEKVSGERWPFAYSILAELEEAFTNEDEPLLQRIYQSIEAGEKVIKTTKRNRLAEVDELIAKELKARQRTNAGIAIHDMASSNAITSLDLFNRLTPEVDVNIHATDYYDKLYLLSFSRKGWTVVLDVNFEPIQIVGQRFVVSTRTEQRSYLPVNLAIEAWLRLTLLPRAKEVVKTIPLDLESQVWKTSECDVAKVWLFHPLCVTMAEQNEKFTLGRRDIFQKSEEKYDVVRMMNILNLAYFSEAQIVEAIVVGANELRPNGLFVVGRCIDEEDSRPRTTAFIKENDRLIPVWDLHGGSEIRDLILQLVL